MGSATDCTKAACADTWPVQKLAICAKTGRLSMRENKSLFDTKRDTGGFRTANYSVRQIWNATSKASLTGPHESAAMTRLPVPLPETTRLPPSHKGPALWRHWPARPEGRPLYARTSKTAAEQKVCCRPGRYRTRTFRRRHTLLLPDILTLNDDCPADLYWGMVWSGPIRRTLA